MSTALFPIRSVVAFCPSFSVTVENQTHELLCWQKVAIVVFALLSVGIVGWTLSYYWRNCLVDQLYAEECAKAQAIFKRASDSAKSIEQSTSATDISADASNQKPIATVETPKPQQDNTSQQALIKKAFIMPKDVNEILPTISSFGNFLIQLNEHIYGDKEHTRLFCFNGTDQAAMILLPQFLFDLIPPGIYFVVYASTDRVAEIAKKDIYENLAKLIEIDPTVRGGVIDLIIAHDANNWNPISNPKTAVKPYFQPTRICQILYQDKDQRKNWEKLCFENERMKETITKFTKTWVADSEKQANTRRREAVKLAIEKLRSKV